MSARKISKARVTPASPDAAKPWVSYLGLVMRHLPTSEASKKSLGFAKEVIEDFVFDSISRPVLNLSFV